MFNCQKYTKFIPYNGKDDLFQQLDSIDSFVRRNLYTVTTLPTTPTTTFTLPPLNPLGTPEEICLFGSMYYRLYADFFLSLSDENLASSCWNSLDYRQREARLCEQNLKTE